MEINVKQARSKISSMLDKVEKGEEMVIVRRGKKVARLVPFNSSTDRRLPDLRKFRASIACPQMGLGDTVVQARDEKRMGIVSH
jgi:prevent-host-death family protein